MHYGEGEFTYCMFLLVHVAHCGHTHAMATRILFTHRLVNFASIARCAPRLYTRRRATIGGSTARRKEDRVLGMAEWSAGDKRGESTGWSPITSVSAVEARPIAINGECPRLLFEPKAKRILSGTRAPTPTGTLLFKTQYNYPISGAPAVVCICGRCRRRCSANARAWWHMN